MQTELNLYKANYNKSFIKKDIRKSKDENKNNIKEIKENIIKNNNKINEEELIKNYIDFNIDKYSIGYDYNKYFKNIEDDKYKRGFDDKIIKKRDLLNGNENLHTKKKENTDKNKLNKDNYQRLNILLENSQNNQRYNEIIKQRELIINSN